MWCAFTDLYHTIPYHTMYVVPHVQPMHMVQFSSVHGELNAYERTLDV